MLRMLPFAARTAAILRLYTPLALVAAPLGNRSTPCPLNFVTIVRYSIFGIFPSSGYRLHIPLRIFQRYVGALSWINVEPASQTSGS